MKEFNEELKDIESKGEFLVWKKGNEGFYLVHGLLMHDGKEYSPWQIGYYHRGLDRIVTVQKKDNSLEFSPELEVLKKEDFVLALRASEVVFGIDKVIKLADEIRVNDFPRHKPKNVQIIIQNLHDVTLWNISSFTDVDVLNIKVNSQTGETISKELISFRELFKMEKGERNSKNL